MWLHPRKGPTEAAARAAIDPETVDKLTRWYKGEGDRDDEIRAIALVRLARSRQLWFACDCLDQDHAPPLLAPACLSTVRTWYLRRLTGEGRAEHHDDCPFRREQVVKAEREARRASAIKRPEQWFSAVDPRPIHLAQRPESNRPNAADETGRLPRLARLLRLLLERAGFDRVDCHKWNREAGIADAFRAVRTAAEGLQVAPGVGLPSLLFTHPKAVESGQLLGVLTRAERSWPRGHAAQAFLMLYARGIDRNRILTAEGPISVGEPLCYSSQSAAEVEADSNVAIGRPAGKLKPGAPWLCLVAYGRPPEGGSIRPLKAWAEPVLSSQSFMPVRTEGERAVLKALQAIGPGLAKRGVTVTATRPLFGEEATDSAELELIQLEIVARETGEIFNLAIEARDGLEPSKHADRRVLDLSNDVADPERIRKHLWGRILRETETAGQGGPLWQRRSPNDRIPASP
jgi:hypothetical protein